VPLWFNSESAAAGGALLDRRARLRRGRGRRRGSSCAFTPAAAGGHALGLSRRIALALQRPGPAGKLAMARRLLVLFGELE